MGETGVEVGPDPAQAPMGKGMMGDAAYPVCTSTRGKVASKGGAASLDQVRDADRGDADFGHGGPGLADYVSGR